MPKSPFVIDVSTIIRRPGSMREMSLDVALPERIGEGVATLPAGSGLAIDVRFETLHEGILASGSAEGEMTAECVRCLDPISETIEVAFAELFAYDEDEAYDYRVVDDSVDLELPIRDALVLELPFQPVCQPDCYGLDPQTGEKLTEPRQEPADSTDPRWAALASFAASDDAPKDAASETTDTAAH